MMTNRIFKQKRIALVLLALCMVLTLLTPTAKADAFWITNRTELESWINNVDPNWDDTYGQLQGTGFDWQLDDAEGPIVITIPPTAADGKQQRRLAVSGDWIIPEEVTIVNQGTVDLACPFPAQTPSSITINGVWQNERTISGSPIYDETTMIVLRHYAGELAVNGTLILESGATLCDVTVNTGGTVQIGNTGMLYVGCDNTLELKENTAIEKVGADGGNASVRLDGKLVGGNGSRVEPRIDIRPGYVSGNDGQPCSNPVLSGSFSAKQIYVSGDALVRAGSMITCETVTCGSPTQTVCFQLDGQLEVSGGLCFDSECTLTLGPQGRLALGPGSGVTARFDASSAELINGAGTIYGSSELNEDGTAGRAPMLFDAKWQYIAEYRPAMVADTVKIEYNWKISAGPSEDPLPGGDDTPSIPNTPNTPSTPSTPTLPPAAPPDIPYIPSAPSTSTGGSNTTTKPSTSTTTTPATDTVTGPDGSTTTTKPDGTVITTAADAAGNKTTITEAPDGSTVTTIENKDGGSSTTTVSANGRVTATVSVPTAAVTAAQASGQAIALPMPEVPLTANTAAAPVITVTTGSSRPVKVEIPVERTTPGTVAVIVNADGTEEVVKTSFAAANSVTLTVASGAIVKIVDNSKSFADTATHWAGDAIAFATAHELFNGTGANSFTPNGTMTRGMMVTVLARYDGVDTAAGATWYEKGVDWAAANNISSGEDLDAPVSREQLATMLYRYAAASGLNTAASGSLNGFPDADSISGYAADAMAWAVGAGLIGGNDKGELNPGGNATRAEVAAILMRFCEKAAI